MRKRQQLKLQQMIIGFIVVLIVSVIGTWITNQSNNASTAPKTQESSSVNFTGENFDVFEKSTKYPLTVGEVADGDTFHVKYKGKDFKVRLLIVDTPETAKEGKAAQPFADEAKERTVALLKQAKTIEGSFDVGDYTDKYGRALMYVYIDGKLLQEQLLEEGYARVGYAYKPNNTLEASFKKVEATAKKKKLRIWEKTGYADNKGFHPEVY